MDNVKYYAGFFDADGSFTMEPQKRADGSYTISIRASLYQKSPEVLREFAADWGVPVRRAGNVFVVALDGSRAQRFMEQVKQHLVIKRQVVEFLLAAHKQVVQDLAPVREALKIARSQGQDKNFPTRQWMAGYVDGDGSILSSYRKKDGNLEFKLVVTSHSSQRAGLDLLQKAFGGIITSQGDVRRWGLSLSVSKGQQVLPFFHKHLKVKGAQAALVLECLRTGAHLKKQGATPESNLVLHLRLQELKRPTTTNSEDTRKGEVIV